MLFKELYLIQVDFNLSCTINQVLFLICNLHLHPMKIPVLFVLLHLIDKRKHGIEAISLLAINITLRKVDTHVSKGLLSVPIQSGSLH